MIADMSHTSETSDRVHARDHETAPKADSPASLKLARNLEARPHDPLARVAGQPRSAGVRPRRKKVKTAEPRPVGAWMPLAVALGVGLTAAAVLRARGRD
jgi:hypothetical protein